MTETTLSERSFTGKDQNFFANLSGDQNPLHVDAVYARRTQLGQQIVHGMHAVIWALETFWEKNPSINISGMSIKFKKPIFLCERVFSFYHNESQSIYVRNANADLINIRLETCDEKFVARDTPSSITCTSDTPINRVISSISRFQNIQADNFVDVVELQGTFKNCERVLGLETLRGLINLSSIVGMVLPGLNSIFSGCKIIFGKYSKEKYLEVTKCDHRFNLCDFTLNETTFVANVSTIFRPAVSVARRHNLASFKKDETLELSDFRILILGGSRGLGEKLTVAAATHGAEVLFTYNKGLSEAMMLESELKSSGCNVSSTQYNAYEPEWDVLTSFKPNIVFYMLTPPIFVKRSRGFEAELYDNFYFFYCDLLNQMCLQLGSEALQLVYYPSSVAVETDRSTNFEYALSKQLGELHVEVLSKKLGFKHLVERLPRLQTDQTASHLNIKSQDSYEFALRILRNSIRELKKDKVIS